MDPHRWLAALPRQTIDLGHRRLPVFRTAGVVGFQVAVATAVLVSLLNGVGVTTALGVCACAGLSFFGWGLARRAVTGRETLVLVEYVWVAIALVAAYIWLAGAPPRPVLDLLTVSLCVFLAAGRLGCAYVGCCHGVPAGLGLVYPPAHGLSARLTGVPLLPVQLLEAAGLLLIGAVGLGLVVTLPAGAATLWFLLGYAVLRFGCEALRGDVRPTLLRVSVPRLTCLLQAGAAVALAELWSARDPFGRELLAAGTVLLTAAAAGQALAWRRGSNPLVGVAHLDEAWEAMTGADWAGGDGLPELVTTSRGLRIGLTRHGALLHVSLSHPDHDALPVAVALAAARGGVTRPGRDGVVHLALPGPAAPDPAVDVPVRAAPLAAPEQAPEHFPASPQTGQDYFDLVADGASR